MLERGRGGVTQMGTTGDGRDLQHNYSDHQPSPALDTRWWTLHQRLHSPSTTQRLINCEISRSKHHSFVSLLCHEPRRKFQKYSDFHHQQDILHPVYRLIIFTVRDEKLEQLKVSQRT